MRKDVARDLSDSAFDFQRAAWPAISGALGGGAIIPVEAVAHHGFDKQLDALAGIDAWQVVGNNEAIRGVASRVQWGRNWRTFTIRIARPSGAATEYEKRLRAITESARGFLFPHLTVQGYIADPKRAGEFVGGAAVRTRDLFLLAKTLNPDDPALFKRRKDYGLRLTYSGETLLWIDWGFMRARGVSLKVVGPRPVKNAAQREIFA